MKAVLLSLVFDDLDDSKADMTQGHDGEDDRCVRVSLAKVAMSLDTVENCDGQEQSRGQRGQNERGGLCEALERGLE